jgi:hypothetical protein
MSRISLRYSVASVASDEKEALSESRGDNAESSPDGTAELGLSKERAWTPRCTALLIVVLAGLSAVVVHRIHVGEFSYNVDETQHAVTGLFAADVMRDRPFAHPVQYTYEYYAQYPALAGVIHWPPLFYVVEGAFFLVLGPTVVAARLAILFFSLVGLTFWFLLVRDLQDEWTAALATALLGLSPVVLLFEKAVMLEVPSLALCLAATYFGVRYLREERKRDVYVFAILAALALLTKQNAIYLAPFCVFAGVWLRGWKWFLRTDVWCAAALCAVLIMPFYTLVYLMHWRPIAMDVQGVAQSHSYLRDLLFYWRALPGQLGWLLLGLSALGMVTSRWWDERANTRVMLAWIAACYVTFTAIGLKESRYALYWVPAFVYFAAGGLTRFFRRPVMRATATAIAGCVLVAIVIPAWAFQRPYVSGYEAAAQRVVQASKCGVILFDGDLAGDFIFFVRANDANRRFLVLRKALYAERIKVRLGSVELVHDSDDVRHLIHDDGVRFVVTMEGTPLLFDSQRRLREILTGPDFELLGRFPIAGNDIGGTDPTLLVYVNRNYSPPAAKTLTIRMLTLSHDITVPFDRFTGVVEK